MRACIESRGSPVPWCGSVAFVTTRPTNFSAGPAILPATVLQQVSQAVQTLHLPHDTALEAQLSILEISHRTPTFEAILEDTKDRARAVLDLPASYDIVFLQGGARMQFAMVPLNLLAPQRWAAYIDTGVWSNKAFGEASRLGDARMVASSEADQYAHLPQWPAPELFEDACYLHITTNNTIYGTEFPDIPHASVPLVADLSSNIASRPMALSNLALGYAGLQKNLGPAGLALVFMDRTQCELVPGPHVPDVLRYDKHIADNSMFVTPNTFAIFVLNLMLRWVQDEGGVVAMAKRNGEKAQRIYDVIDSSSLFRGHAEVESRSRMNVTWTLAGGAAQTADFLAQATAAGFAGLAGHRFVGGCRASIYNAFPLAGVEALCSFMREFERRA